MNIGNKPAFVRQQDGLHGQLADLEVVTSFSGRRCVQLDGNEYSKINDLVNALHDRVVLGKEGTGKKYTVVQYENVLSKLNEFLTTDSLPGKGTFNPLRALATHLHAIRSLLGNIGSKRQEKLDNINQKLNEKAKTEQVKLNEEVKGSVEFVKTTTNETKNLSIESDRLIESLRGGLDKLKHDKANKNPSDDMNIFLSRAHEQVDLANETVGKAKTLAQKAEDNFKALQLTLENALAIQKEAKNTIGSRGEPHSTIPNSIEVILERIEVAHKSVEAANQNVDTAKELARQAKTEFELTVVEVNVSALAKINDLIDAEKEKIDAYNKEREAPRPDGMLLKDWNDRKGNLLVLISDANAKIRKLEESKVDVGHA